MLSTEMVAAALVSTEWVEVMDVENELAGVIGACDGGIKGCICGEVRTRDVDGEVAAGINGASGVGGAVDGEGDGVSCAASPLTEPVTATVPAASVALMMSSAVMLSTEMVAAALVSTEWGGSNGCGE